MSIKTVHQAHSITKSPKKNTTNKMDDLFFGFDLSTQQLKLLVTDSKLQVHSTHSLEFDVDLPHYTTNKGVHSNDETGEITAPVQMWIEAVDLLLSRLSNQSFPFHRVKGISGSCQQHGSVYWSSKAKETLSSLSPKKSLLEQLTKENFSIETSPNWQDHSTSQEIKSFEDYVNGAENLAKLTGSRAHYRFTGPQIRKFKKTKPELYAKTDRISLVSSFLASLFLGEITGIEEADACGMNLYDVLNKDWNDELLEIATLTHDKDGITDKRIKSEQVKELRRKLQQVVKIGSSSIGTISRYYQQRYGFQPDTKIYSFTGDNLATILALPLSKDEVLISLGTSTTVLLVTDKYVPSSNYHLFIHPTIPNHYMGMICYCNGSLAREKVRDELNSKYGIKDSKSWDKFNGILDGSSRFNESLGIYFPLGEIVPNRKAQTIRAKYDQTTNNIEIISNWDIELDVSSIVESQALSCRARLSPMLSIRNKTPPETIKPLEFDDKLISSLQLAQRPNKIIFVGGASKNQSIIKKFSSILGSIDGNFRYDNSNACAIGGAFKAHWSYYNETNESIGFHEFLDKYFKWEDLDEVDAIDEWENYIDGVNALNLLEQALS